MREVRIFKIIICFFHGHILCICCLKAVEFFFKGGRKTTLTDYNVQEM